MTNIEGIKKINELMEQNPGVDVMFMTATEVVADTDKGYWRCGIGSVELKEVWYNHSRERLEIGKDDIEEAIAYQVEDDIDFENATDEEVSAEVDRRYVEYKENGEIKTYILVKLEV
jgi:hypothetical protein